MSYRVIAFYNFSPLSERDQEQLEERLYALANASDLNGLMITAPEGLNATLAGSYDIVAAVEKFILSIPGFSETKFKYSESETKPFRRFKVKRRDEIVTLNRKDLVPTDLSEAHISPEEWNKLLEQEDVVVIDTRNTYETELGMFRGAVDPRIKHFSQFPEWVKKSQIDKDKTVLMYCTGGIRCEKAYLEMKDQGYKKVYPLDGGILKYLEECPDGAFEGECFVFDHRVAVDANLKPSKKYHLCAHCGDPASQEISCERCEQKAVVCDTCLQSVERRTCSKDCSYHYALGLGSSSAPAIEV